MDRGPSARFSTLDEYAETWVRLPTLSSVDPMDTITTTHDLAAANGATAGAATQIGLPSTAIPPKPVEIRQVHSRRDRLRFIRFPYTIYKDDPRWSPSLEVEALDLIDRRKHPFYEHGEAVQFIAIVDGQVVGRIQASDDPNFNAQHNSSVGHFGQFECVASQRVADALFTAAADWLRVRGRTEMHGPVDYSTSYNTGLLIDGFDTPQRVMMNHNPPYYIRLFENWHLEKAKDLYAWWFDNDFDMLNRWSNLAKHLARRGNVHLRPFRFDDFDAEAKRCLSIYNRCWEQNWGFVRMTEAEFLHMAGQLKKFADPRLMQIAEVDGELAGMSVVLPDINEATRPLRGRLTRYGLPINLARLMWNLRRIRTGRLAALGVVPEHRRRGVTELFILSAIEVGKELGYTGGELSWTLEDNELINSTIEKVGGRRYKTYRVYQTAI